MASKSLAAYKRAEKKVKDIKGFYRHLTIYLIVNAIIVIEGLEGINFLELNTSDIDPSFVEWLVWNVFSVPLLWGIVLLIHGLQVYSFHIPILKKWEAEQIRKMMEKEETKNNKPLI
ncbi:2TM domain-containing protein [Muriicola soli]|uniref:2TM domain-containing protein n=1 Tax=Muriicola soli TaxID=2507538 RepID=A0A411EA18_9FLAO|nr:2TM domain-containing protein [Muriicola soli]QBA64488.1 2TM domain-containing protein [Muriicola soli]